MIDLLSVGVRSQKVRHKPLPLQQLQNPAQNITKVPAIYPGSETLRGYCLSKPKSLNFGRKLEEHKKIINPNGNLTVWAPKADQIFIEWKDKNLSDPGPQGAGTIKIQKIKDKFTIAPDNEHSKIQEMKSCGEGMWETGKIPIKQGDRYRFILADKQGKILFRKDPCILSQPEIDSWSEYYNHDVSADTKWLNNPERFSLVNPKLTSPSKAVIYEMHGETFNKNLSELLKNGDTEKIKKMLKPIKDLGFNAIEIMPVGNHLGNGWGYDAVDPFTVRKSLGGPDGFKKFINSAHDLGLNVIMDVVPSHIPVFKNVLNDFGEYEGKSTEWGPGYNLEPDHNKNNKGHNNDKHVRDYLVNTALNWLINYKCDGLRLDMTKKMTSDNALKQIVSEVNFHCPDAPVIAEHGQEEVKKDKDGKIISKENDPRIVRKLTPQEKCGDESKHVEMINKIENNNTSLDNVGCDFQWGFPFNHALHTLVTHRDFNGDYKYKGDSWHADAMKFLDQMFLDPMAGTNIAYPMSHDEIGNNDGTRLVSKLLNIKLNMTDKINSANTGDAKRDAAIKGQNAANAAQKLLEAYYSGDDKIWNNQQELKINNPVSKDEFKKVLKEAQALNRLALGVTFAYPGPKMLFQGDEYGSIQRFKFFVKYPEGEKYTGTDPGYSDLTGKPLGDKVNREKGYSVDDGTAFKESILDRESAKNELKTYYDNTEKYTKKLIELFKNNPALNNGKSDQLKPYRYGDSNVMQVHRWDKATGNEVLIVMNFEDQGWQNYQLKDFPDGNWEEALNSDNSNNNEYKNTGIINRGNCNIKLPKQSILIFKKK
ncbi:MAG: alpha-amylase family glycosyl hydrolase [bacterium]